MSHRTALLTYRTGNIGDDVQSFSLAQPHLHGPPDVWIDRDQFPDYADAGPIQLTANGFFICPDRTGKLAFPPPPNVTVRYVALCASNIPDTPATREHLKASSPIGCRDQHTVRWCEKRGIDHYFASCPSILLEREFVINRGGERERVDAEAPARGSEDPLAHARRHKSGYDKNGPIVLVDVNPKRLPPFGISDRPFICLTNRIRPRDYPDPAARFHALRRRLRILAGASLVITNRLHTAMPTIGMGVPVLMVEADELDFRLTALPDWLKIHRKGDLSRVNLDPAAHYTAEFLENRGNWRAMVRERLEARM